MTLLSGVEVCRFPLHPSRTGIPASRRRFELAPTPSTSTRMMPSPSGSAQTPAGFRLLPHRDITEPPAPTIAQTETRETPPRASAHPWQAH